jgi:CRP/FNR family transcriptional regulator
MEPSMACPDLVAQDRSRRRNSTVRDWNSSVAEVLSLLGADPAAEPQAARVPLALRRLRAGETLFYEGSPATALYIVRAGLFKTLRTAQDGYEQIVDFAGRAELLGFDAICSGVYPSAALALEESSVHALPLTELDALALQIPTLGRAMYRALSCALARRGDLAEMMAAVAAEVRLARFLMLWSQRMAAQGQSARRLYLRMSRREIASNLGVAHETVSRSFSALVHAGLVRVDNREVEILDAEALAAFARSTRRPPDEAEDRVAPQQDRGRQAGVGVDVRSRPGQARSPGLLPGHAMSCGPGFPRSGVSQARMVSSPEPRVQLARA